LVHIPSSLAFISSFVLYLLFFVRDKNGPHRTCLCYLFLNFACYICLIIDLETRYFVLSDRSLTTFLFFSRHHHHPSSLFICHIFPSLGVHPHSFHPTHSRNYFVILFHTRPRFVPFQRFSFRLCQVHSLSSGRSTREFETWASLLISVPSIITSGIVFEVSDGV